MRRFFSIACLLLWAVPRTAPQEAVRGRRALGFAPLGLAPYGSETGQAQVPAPATRRMPTAADDRYRLCIYHPIVYVYSIYMNETITENMVRQHFNTDNFCKNNMVDIEEKSSKNTKINSLLAHASKRCTGKKGFPEFIIQFRNDAHLIMIIECKANIHQHESEDKNRYTDYAVDGVLLYAAFLSREYDVIAIAASGNDNNHRISHFLHLKGEQCAHSIFNDDTLLTLEDYLEGYNKDERKFNQDFKALLEYSKELNNKLHTLKVKASERSLLISGTLIALTDKAFINSYKYTSPSALSQLLVNTIKEKLASTRTRHTDDIITSYSFITTHTILARQDGTLKNIIDEIDRKINTFMHTHQYFDTLGQFYIEFLRYANNDKALGIVLTPPHITELFCEIAHITKDSIVLDTCTGTGGFLISAMKQMIIDADGNTEKERGIKEHRIIGVELQHDIYSLLCSNMRIHGDGRSNLLKGSCFDNDIQEEVAKFKPNVGFLNPPYKTNTNDKEELEFVINILGQLSKGGYCIAIVPMSCAIATDGDIADLKKQILKKHTLEAVFSMPNDLFKNSDVGIVTCIMVIKCKEPHNRGYKSYFGYWKDDGYYTMKTRGRADYDDRWIGIKNTWITNYRNRENIAGHSVTKEVTHTDEWCSEAYMETDYSSLNEDDFSKTIKDFVIFKLKNNLIDEVAKRPAIYIKNPYPLNIVNWEYHYIQDIFEVMGSRHHTKKQISKYGAGQYPFVSTSSENNGVNGFYDHYTETGNILTIDSATIGTCFYQPKKFSASDHVEKLVPKFEMNVFSALFIQTIIGCEKFRYGYGRKFAQKRIRITKIKIPTTQDNKPDTTFMENYIKSLPYSSNL